MLEEKIRKLEEAQKILEELKDDKAFEQHFHELLEGYGPNRGTAGLVFIETYFSMKEGAKRIGLVLSALNTMDKYIKTGKVPD